MPCAPPRKAAAEAVVFDHVGDELSVFAGEVAVDAVFPGADAHFLDVLILIEVPVLEVVFVSACGFNDFSGLLLQVEGGRQDAVRNLLDHLLRGPLHGILQGNGHDEGVGLPLLEGDGLVVRVGGGFQLAAGQQQGGRRKGKEFLHWIKISHCSFVRCRWGGPPGRRSASGRNGRPFSRRTTRSCRRNRVAGPA